MMRVSTETMEECNTCEVDGNSYKTCESHSVEWQRYEDADLCLHLREDHESDECRCDGTCYNLPANQKMWSLG